MNLYCSIDGYHQDEPLEMICVSPECVQQQKVLNCIVCIEEHHQGHQVIHYSKFIKLLQKQGLQLFNDLSLKDRDGEDDLTAKYKKLINQLNQLQTTINETIIKQKEAIQRKMTYFEKFSSILPQYDTFLKVLKQRDSDLLAKLIGQFFQKVEYNTKRQDFQLRNEPLIDYSEETIGENELFRKLKEAIDLFRPSNQINPLEMNYNYHSQGSLKSISFPRKIQRLDEGTSNNFRPLKSAERSPLTPPEDRISVSQSLSQYYYKPTTDCMNKVIGESVPLILRNNNGSLLGYGFHNEYFGEGVQITSKQAKLIVDSDKKMALIKPAIYGCGVAREQTLKLLVKMCKNTNQRFPMAVGICLQEKLKADNFIFSGFAEHVTGPGKPQKHGCYLLNANGCIRSETNDMVKSNPNVRFYSNSVLEITFKPFHKLLVINRDQNVQCTIPLELNDSQKFFFCIRLADLNDCVEIMS